MVIYVSELFFNSLYRPILTFIYYSKAGTTYRYLSRQFLKRCLGCEITKMSKNVNETKEDLEAKSK